LCEVVALNLNPRILFAKKLFFELEKMCEPAEAGQSLLRGAKQ